jgi:molecular chaperone GrpE
MSTEDTSVDLPDDPATTDEALRQERDELHERLLRVTAEFDNYRKRTDRERREQAEYASADLIRDLLPVIDDLERALAASVDAKPGAEQVATYRQGVELIRKQLAEVLRRRGVETIDVIGKDFDPQWHEAIASDPIDGHRDGEITAEVRRGYKIGQRLIRPAMVKVAKA